MSKEIPLTAGLPHQTLSATLGDYKLEFAFYFVVRFGYFRVDIKDVTATATEIVNGEIAHVDVDLLRYTKGKYGAACIKGEEPTIDNIGITAKLMWSAPDA